MFWDKKENKGELPDLPPLKPELTTLPVKETDEEDNESDFSIDKHPLPSFPDSPTKKGFSQSAIKDAVDNQESRENEVKELESDSSAQFLPPPQVQKIQMSKSSSNSNVFVKIDKFNSARKALSAAQQKVQDIDKMLKKIREARMREEQELTAWEKEVESAKTQIEEASKNLFEKLS
ncbi:MAG: hypothetical protein AABX66_00115 [Nanoarchaeota archaeon]